MARKNEFDRRAEREDEREIISRTEENRNADTREFEKNIMMHMQWQDPLYIDPRYIPAGMEWRWIRESYRDMPDDARIAHVMSKGWTPVKPEQLPHRMNIDLFKRKTHLNSYVHFGGLILFERPERLCDLERSQLNRFNAELRNKMPGIEQLRSDPTMPATSLMAPGSSLG